jgi:pyruvate, orthophosphate dikinase
MYSDVVLGVDHDEFEDILGDFKDRNDYALDTELTPRTGMEVVKRYKAHGQEHTGKPFPQDVRDQLWGAIGAVFASWERCARHHLPQAQRHIPDDWGTAVNVQAMVFGNMGDDHRHRCCLHPQPLDRRQKSSTASSW